MGKVRAFFSLLYHGLFYFAFPSLLFFWLTVSARLPGFPIKITLLNYYLPKFLIELFSFSLGSLTLPVGVRITVTSILGLFVTFFGVLGCLLQDISTVGSIKLKQNKFLGFFKNLIIMVWVWLGFHQFSNFILDINGLQFTLLLQLQFYLVAGMLVAFFTAIANLLQATDVEKSDTASMKDLEKNEQGNIVLGKK